MQALDSTAKQKIAAEPMGATNIFNFTVEPISYTSSRFSIWGLGFFQMIDLITLFTPNYQVNLSPIALIGQGSVLIWGSTLVYPDPGQRVRMISVVNISNARA